MTKFSLTMSVYAKENPQHLAKSLESVLSQTVLPDEIIIVKDGPLTQELENALQNVQFPNEMNIIALPENVTQGPARAEGVKAAKHEWIAIMDSDDICRPDRFEKQLKMIEENPELALIGGQIAEFAETPENVTATRAVPLNHGDIAKFAKKRNPFSQMTVMFRRDTALAAGNYRYFPWFEDYDLWTRMIKNGAACANHPDVLVDVRTGAGMYGRRRGATYIRSEWRMQKQLRKLGFTNTVESIRNIALRIPVRLLPGRALAIAYNKFARRNTTPFDYSNQPGRTLKKTEHDPTAPPLISIITPYYNGAEYFEQTYFCVMNQTFTQYEWIIADDGSTDKPSLDLLERLAATDARITVLHKENGGISSAQNHGIRRATTDYILPLDADDLIEPWYVETLYNALEQHPDCSWAYTNTVCFQDEERLSDRPFDAKQQKIVNSLNKTALIRKRPLFEAGLYYEGEKHFTEDWHMWLKLLSLSCRPLKINRFGFWYRRNFSNGVRAIVEADPEIMKRSRKLIEEAAKTADTSVTAREIGASTYREEPLRKLARIATHNPPGAKAVCIAQRIRQKKKRKQRKT